MDAPGQNVRPAHPATLAPVACDGDVVAHALIHGDGVDLRPTSEDDLGTLRTLFTDPGVVERWGGTPLTDEEISSKYLGTRSPGVECFIVEGSGVPVGFVQYHRADYGVGGGMDLVLAVAERNRGVGTAVVEAMVEFVSTELGWQRLTVDPDASNPRGVKFWEKAGFRHVRLVDDDPTREPYHLMEWPLRELPSIETPRLTGRSVAVGDLVFIGAVWNDERVAPTIGGPRTEQQLNERVERWTRHWDAHGFGATVFLERTTAQPIAWGGLQRSTIGIGECLTVGYVIAPDAWGRGLASEIAAASVVHAFDVLDADKVHASVLATNAATCRVLENVGLSVHSQIDHGDHIEVIYVIER
jgi:aminoglycoside 6'-N-acetyltransferase